jgi:hypothetical protein
MGAHGDHLDEVALVVQQRHLRVPLDLYGARQDVPPVAFW